MEGKIVDLEVLSKQSFLHPGIFLMHRSERTLYRAFLRLLREYRSEQIPFTGVAGSRVTNWGLDGVAAVHNGFVGGSAPFEQGNSVSLGFEGKC